MGRGRGIVSVVLGAGLGACLLLALLGVAGTAALAVAGACVCGLFGAPFLAAFALRGAGPEREPWSGMAALAGAGAAAGAAGGWLFAGNVFGLFALGGIACLAVVPVLSAVLVGQGLLWMGRNPDLGGAVRGGWKTVLLLGVAAWAGAGSGALTRSLETRRAKAWVEDAAAAVRAERSRSGALPGTWIGLDPALRSPPRFARGVSYAVSADGGGSFTLRFEDGSELFGGGWSYDGATGAWSRWRVD